MKTEPQTNCPRSGSPGETTCRRACTFCRHALPARNLSVPGLLPPPTQGRAGGPPSTGK